MNELKTGTQRNIMTKWKVKKEPEPISNQRVDLYMDILKTKEGLEVVPNFCATFERFLEMREMNDA